MSISACVCFLVSACCKLTLHNTWCVIIAENRIDISSCTVTIKGTYVHVCPYICQVSWNNIMISIPTPPPSSPPSISLPLISTPSLPHQISRKELLALDFEGILGFFRVSLPKKFQSEEDCQLLFDTMFTFKVNEKKLSKLQKDYQSYLEQQAQLEDPVMRLERDNKALRDTIHRLEQENDNLAQDLVSSKIKLRFDMDKVREETGGRELCCNDGITIRGFMGGHWDFHFPRNSSQVAGFYLWLSSMAFKLFCLFVDINWESLNIASKQP